MKNHPHRIGLHLTVFMVCLCYIYGSGPGLAVMVHALSSPTLEGMCCVDHSCSCNASPGQICCCSGSVAQEEESHEGVAVLASCGDEGQPSLQDPGLKMPHMPASGLTLSHWPHSERAWFSAIVKATGTDRLPPDKIPIS